ncbi:phosphatidylinositol phosphate kinase motif-containing protein [Pandoravirus inopinatum]|uniref:Phosphatidylinositol phosphate kinase motif-containing protein n=1 Tax=Pandoravirus inopinatum TaxID=1605721 RepID=A0A0B5JDA2_9VIRU|nr:phosphatidylinositol phosphate kinase motif-containing protein [Pandoravirus inopinatum]AJF97647.1 phosphatidylinositol phosphate kinase motif-containing protein [Pandoravirus inopinatum]
MSDGPSLASLPPELLWTIADMLLDGTGSVFNVGRLALVCTATMFLLADDKTWRARCRRHFGRARTNIHAHAERFGVRWVHIYVSMANVMTPDGSAGLSKCPRRTWGMLSLPGLRYWGRIIDGRPRGYGVYATHDSAGGTIVTEAALDEDGRRSGWISAARTTCHYAIPAGPCHDEERTHCVCHMCLGQYPGLTGRLHRLMMTYAGDWDAGRIQGHGRADLADGLVYEGTWVDGVPHGRGELNGSPYCWYRGLCIDVGTWTGRLYTGGLTETTASVDGEWTFRGDVIMGTSATDDDVIKRWCAIATVDDKRILGASTYAPAWSRGPVPHGHGRATCSDGRVYVGTWHRGVPERGQCTSPDGLVRKGLWRICPQCTHGVTVAASHQRPRPYICIVWRLHDEPCRDGRDEVCDCANPRVEFATRRSGWGLGVARPHDPHRIWSIVYSNGDRCRVIYDANKRVTSVVRFDCSTHCPDPDFVGLVITSEAGWSPTSVDRDSLSVVYWPNDPDSDAFARFVAYVRKGYIGWTPNQVDTFWAAVADLGVVVPTMHAENEPQS